MSLMALGGRLGSGRAGPDRESARLPRAAAGRLLGGARPGAPGDRRSVASCGLRRPGRGCGRLVLDAVGVPAITNEKKLKGGRLLGPMERIFVVGLGHIGEVTAAAIVVAAKGLLRFPELQAGTKDVDGPSDVTEYFLIGELRQLADRTRRCGVDLHRVTGGGARAVPSSA